MSNENVVRSSTEADLMTGIETIEGCPDLGFLTIGEKGIIFKRRYSFRFCSVYEALKDELSELKVERSRHGQ